MTEPKHAVEKVEMCDVDGCRSEAVRSISSKKVENAGLKLSPDIRGNAHLCHEHYKEFKKRTKKDRTYDRLGW
jgi:hypothetical protein